MRAFKQGMIEAGVQGLPPILGKEVEISKVTSNEFPRPAARPGYSVLDTSKLTRVLGRTMPPWRDALSRYLESSCAS